MKTTNNGIKRYWHLWLSLLVGAAILGIQIAGNSCQLVPDAHNQNGEQIYSCPGANYSEPVIILIICWLAAMIATMKTLDMVNRLRSRSFGLDFVAPILIGYFLCQKQFWYAYFATLAISILEIFFTAIHDYRVKKKTTKAKQKGRKQPRVLVVDRIEATKGYSSDMLIAIAAAVAPPSNNTELDLIHQYAIKHHIKLAPASSIRKALNGGMYATIDRRRLVIGDYDFMLATKIQGLPDHNPALSAIYIAVNGHYIGAIHFSYN